MGKRYDSILSDNNNSNNTSSTSSNNNNENNTWNIIPWSNRLSLLEQEVAAVSQISSGIFLFASGILDISFPSFQSISWSVSPQSFAIPLPLLLPTNIFPSSRYILFTVSIVSILLLLVACFPNLAISLLISFIVAITIVEGFGFLWIMGESLNIFSSWFIFVALGSTVDYCIYIGYSFLAISPNSNNNSNNHNHSSSSTSNSNHEGMEECIDWTSNCRVFSAMNAIGPTLLNMFFSSLVGLFPLISIPSSAHSIYWKITMVILFLSFFHSTVLLPLLLAWIPLVSPSAFSSSIIPWKSAVLALPCCENKLRRIWTSSSSSSSSTSNSSCEIPLTIRVQPSPSQSFDRDIHPNNNNNNQDGERETITPMIL